ncbi:UDP-N-acetylmuramoyl-L-alanyl-D-glutamate--2,6-diaminopimelate ligase [Fusibacter sp. 3D3]|uniref:UDP-N-acetylmuramoyl-L-alanyl-D-glutamate--2, 6-diaminopimelate ligase n=1 Tax=Fusibacter sp. 3D3 TaxID=1048380 RepID=UPI000853A80D|nr:UDP-N-acetylmuramoyl-L-alanyl-D-glutamate--2,6-diaminopimelate ligase [Fusibacter sp. 3D3]GAU78688.1 UDP-N-acetylmuramoylalanyl-D-glutamate-2,6-diaminopimelate ligase [Fusibacter sp. 3D3]
MILSEILKQSDYKIIKGTIEKEIKAIQHHSDKIEKDTLFVAISGYQRDGHDFIEQVIRDGATAVVVERHIDLDQIPEAVSVIRVVDTKLALAEMVNAFYDHPTEKINVVGITGTNGKTSITQMLNNLYTSFGQKNAVFGTIANFIGDEKIPTVNTTPDALELARLMNRASEVACDNCFMEVSSHALKMGRVHGMHFNYAVFTNLTEDHLDFHPDFEDYFMAKLQLFKMALKGCVINNDNVYGRRILKEVSLDKRCLSYGLTKASELWANHIEYHQWGSTFNLNWGEQHIPVRLNIPGKIYVYNVMACVGVMILQGFKMDAIGAFVSEIEPVRGRLESVSNDHSRTILLDYAHTPDALENVLHAIREFSRGKIITVFGCGGDRDRKKRPMMGAIAQKLSDLVILTSDNPRTEAPNQIIKDVLEGMTVSDQLYVVEDRREGIYKALSLASENDVVLIAGKGHEDYQIIGKTKIHFDDKEVVQDFYDGRK